MRCEPLKHECDKKAGGVRDKMLEIDRGWNRKRSKRTVKARY